MTAPAIILEGGSYKHDARDFDPACTPQPRASSVASRESPTCYAEPCAYHGDALRPCPFCGGDAMLQSTPNNCWVMCQECQSAGPILDAANADAVAAAWNVRATEETTDLVSTIHWTRTSERLPAYGHTVALWLPTLGLVVRGYRDATIDKVTYRYAGEHGPVILASLVASWAELPNGVLPPPDGGAV